MRRSPGRRPTSWRRPSSLARSRVEGGLADPRTFPARGSKLRRRALEIRSTAPASWAARRCTVGCSTLERSRVGPGSREPPCPNSGRSASDAWPFDRRISAARSSNPGRSELEPRPLGAPTFVCRPSYRGSPAILTWRPGGRSLDAGAFNLRWLPIVAWKARHPGLEDPGAIAGKPGAAAIKANMLLSRVWRVVQHRRAHRCPPRRSPIDAGEGGRERAQLLPRHLVVTPSERSRASAPSSDETADTSTSPAGDDASAAVPGDDASPVSAPRRVPAA